MYFRNQLFGYSKHEVTQFITNLEKDKEALQQQVNKNQDLIQELRYQLSNVKQRENFVGEAMIEVRQLSQSLLTNTKETAEEEAKAVLEEAAQRLERAEETLMRIDRLTKSFASYEDIVKTELREIFEGFLARTEEITLFASAGKYHEIQPQVQEVKHDVAQTKAIITFPKETGKNKEDESVPVFAVE